MTKNRLLTVDQWAELEQDRLKKFVEVYKKGMQEDPECWPQKMSIADFDDNYLSFDLT